AAPAQACVDHSSALTPGARSQVDAPLLADERKARRQRRMRAPQLGHQRLRGLRGGSRGRTAPGAGDAPGVAPIALEERLRDRSAPDVVEDARARRKGADETASVLRYQASPLAVAQA